jgi:predicted helicase
VRASNVARIHYADLWGGRDGKYHWLLEHDLASTDWEEVEPSTPFYLFTPQNVDMREEYEQGWRVTDMMPVNVLGFQTHRDDFAIDLDREKLRERIADMRGTTLSDDAFRQQYKILDSVRWSLPKVRARLRNTVDWERDFIDCLYRPFDRRPCYFSDIAMDRPRRELVRHVAGKQNLCLNTVRQTREAEWKHALASDAPTPAVFVEIKDGSSIFPLYLYPDLANPSYLDTTIGPSGPHGRTPNLNPDFVAEFSARLGFTFVSDGRGDLETTFGPEDIFHYAYAVFHSPEYRSRYAEFLKIDFPRLPLTSDRELFRALAGFGARLVDLHLLRVQLALITGFPVGGDNVVAAGHPKYDEGRQRVYINKTQHVSDVPPEVWEFQIGGYQVCEKWLKDRRGRTLSYDDIMHYQRVVAALSETIQLMAQIDDAIGEFPIS